MRSRGFTPPESPNSKPHHEHERIPHHQRPRPTLRKLWRQYFQYGSWKRRVLKMHPGSTRLRQLVPPLFIIALLGSVALAFTPWRMLGLITPVLYAGLLAVATLVRLARTGDPAALLLPAAAATMHVAWGLGFLSSR